MNAIETERLTKRFRRVRGYRELVLYPFRRTTVDTAVHDVSFDVRRGELFGVLGENGAGKTTLIRMLSTTLLPTSGRAIVGGYDVVQQPHLVRRVIGLVNGDERSFYWRLTGRQNLWYFATLYHVPHNEVNRRVDRVLDTLAISRYADRRFDSFSTGIRQRFGIARGMLTDPQVLFLDEPTRALDPIAADELRSHVANHIVGELGYTVLLATHTLTEAEAICDRIAIIRGGDLVEMGTVEQLRSRMGLSTLLELVVSGAGSGFRDTLCAISGVEGVDVEQDASGMRLRLRLAERDHVVDHVVRAAVSSGVVIEAIDTQQPTLDDIYRAAHADHVS